MSRLSVSKRTQSSKRTQKRTQSKPESTPTTVANRLRRNAQTEVWVSAGISAVRVRASNGKNARAAIAAAKNGTLGVPFTRGQRLDVASNGNVIEVTSDLTGAGNRIARMVELALAIPTPVTRDGKLASLDAWRDCFVAERYGSAMEVFARNKWRSMESMLSHFGRSSWKTTRARTAPSRFPTRRK
jgi:hypothetical protein